MSHDATARFGGFVLPTGTVTFVMTDIEGSTRGWERSPVEMSAAVARHYEILDQAVHAHDGVRPIEQGEGDSVVAAFSRPSDAVAAALDAQRVLGAEVWSTPEAVRVRMALHTGEAQLRDEGNYFGPVVIRCARIRAVGHGGQVLISDATASLVGGVLPAGATLTDLGVVRLKDLGRPERVWQLGDDELSREFPPLRGLDSYPQNLPAQVTPLVGRAGEIATVAELLASERLVTLTGAGGVGKTRLALAVGAELVEEHPGGVWFVDLAGTGGPHSAGRAALRALGVAEAPPSLPSEQVAGELADAGRSLLILDNCEHTLDDVAAFVSTVLGGSPAVTVLATSREPLGVGGEVTWRVPSLPTPDGREPIAIESLSQFDAVTLFMECARRARPSFRVTDANAPAVAQICQRLDGIPLAIELAAARLRHLSAERIAQELDDRFRLLVGGSRVVLPRQQTLAASVAWSHDLLSDDEQLVLRRLGVFAGRFELDAAEHVVAALGDFDAVQVFDAVSRLVDKSLLVADEDGPEVLYRMLETIRAFAVERAREADELVDLGDAHVGWWNRRLTGLGVTGPTDDVVALVEAHHDDLVAALNWATEHDLSSALDLSWPLTRAFQGAGSAGDVLPAVERLLDADSERTDPQRWVRSAIGAAIVILFFRGRAPFMDLISRCERVALEIDDETNVAASRWLANMNVETSQRLRDVAARHQTPYAYALATVRLAIDACDQAPDILEVALADARRVADEYHSQYIRDYVAAAHAHRAAIYGDLPTALEIATELATAHTPAMRRHAYELLLNTGLAAGDQAALTIAAELAEHDRRRGVADGDLLLDSARSTLALIQGHDAPRTPLRLEYHPLIACRDAVDRGALDLDRDELAQLAPNSVVRHAYRHILDGLIDANEDAWHAALDIALQHDVRPVAVDALEGLAVIAAASDSSVEAMRLLGAADRLMDETGYRWRFPSERRKHDNALAAANADLGDDAATAWTEGRALEWHDASEYARRARGARKRPRHGWHSLTPTELKVVNLVAEGHSNPEIAEHLLMSRSTVKTHLEHVYTKTGIRNRAELTAEVVRRQPNASEQ